MYTNFNKKEGKKNNKDPVVETIRKTKNEENPLIKIETLEEKGVMLGKLTW